MGIYVSQKAKDNILKYKYSGCDSSIISKWMQPFWGWFVEMLPKSFAPNLVTLIGFIAIVLSYLITLYYMPLMSGDAPGWLYLFNAFCIFVYQTMDAVDGKQARRTNSSSGLGELFDHGCDSLITFFVMQTFQSSIQIGCNQISFFTTLWIMLVFFTAQWEQYHTGIMNLGYFGPTESQFSMMAGHIITFIWGKQFWFNTIHFSNFDIQVNHLLLLFVIAGGLGTIILNIYAIIKRGNTSVISSLFDLLPIISLIVVSFYWGQYSTVNIFETAPHYFMASFGIISSFITCKLILARICMVRLSPFQTIMLPLILILLNIFKYNGTLFDETLFTKIYFYVTSIVYIHFAFDVITSLTKVLGIYCFKLKPQSSSKKTF